MERRLFLAIGLSLMVVWIWSLTTPKPQLRSRDTKVSQHLEIKEDTETKKNHTAPSPSPDSTLGITAERVKATEITETLESEKLTAEFSNIGASLNKVTINEYSATLPLENIASLSGYEDVPFNFEKYDDGVRYYYDDNNFKVIKSYAIQGDGYIIESGIEFYNKTEMSKLLNVEIGSYMIEMSSLDKKSSKLDPTKSRDKSLMEYVINTASGIHRKAGAFKFSSKEKANELVKVIWSGFRDRYFCMVFMPRYDARSYNINPVDDYRLRVGIESEEISVPPKGSVRFDSIIYVGPEKIELLKRYDMGFEKIKRYYRFALFDSIAKIIGNFMNLIFKVIPNWGVCIIITSIVIYFSMYPLTMRGMLSMKRMQSLQPIIVKLKEKHKDNPQKMNKEMMELYKEHKVNPIGGCLPMLLQMPVFIGLYQVLWRSVSFKGAHFLWIKDLSQPDRLFTFPFSLPLLGNEFNLLPVTMIVVMFFQQKLSTKNIVVTDPAQVAQQRMMANIMPVFLGFIFYKFASGLTLYFTMFYFFSTFTQWKMSKVEKGI